jgi:putative component of toxin-antitoxin plasmid stabilization module
MVIAILHEIEGQLGVRDSALFNFVDFGDGVFQVRIVLGKGSRLYI